MTSSTHAMIVRALLCSYPEAWRREYGPELEDLLLSGRLGLWTISDVLVSGLGQRVRAIDATARLGLATMLVIVGGAVWNAAGPSPVAQALGYLLEKTRMTLPTVVVAPMNSDPYALFLMACGWWLHRRRGGTRSAIGKETMKITFIAGIPVMGIGVLMLAGAMDPHALNPWAVLVAPISRLPISWIWGAVGAQLARMVPRLTGVARSPD